MRRTFWTTALAVALMVLPALAAGHPPVADPHNSCLQPFQRAGPKTPPVRVVDTLSYLAPLGSGLPCTPADVAEWGSHAPPCPPPPFVGPIPGAYCGPVIPGGALITCTWVPVLNTVPTELVIGFDGLGGGPNGFVNLAGQGERPVWGTHPPGAWTVVNPYGVPARVIAFPTNIGGPALAPGDLNDVFC